MGMFLGQILCSVKKGVEKWVGRLLVIIILGLRLNELGWREIKLVYTYILAGKINKKQLVGGAKIIE